MSNLTKWWDRPRERGRQGDCVRVAGTDLFVTCPKCKEERVVYNGNYFCDGWGYTCDWALAHPARSKRDRAFCDAVGLDYS